MEGGGNISENTENNFNVNKNNTNTGNSLGITDINLNMLPTSVILGHSHKDSMTLKSNYSEKRECRPKKQETNNSDKINANKVVSI